MPTFDEMVENTRLRLGDPRAQRPNAMQILNEVCTHARTLLRHRRATGNPWNFNDLTVQVVPNQDTYQITQADFGQPVAVLSYAPQLPTWIPRLIPFFLPQNMPYDWSLPQNAGAWFWPADGSNCTAMRCAFYWRDNNAYIEFLPVPTLACQYRVRYLQNTAGTVDSMALTQAPTFSEDSDLIEVRSALSLLPVTEWWAGDDKEGRVINTEKRRDLVISLSAVERELTRQFEAAALQVSGPRLNLRWYGAVDGGGYY